MPRLNADDRELFRKWFRVRFDHKPWRERAKIRRSLLSKVVNASPERRAEFMARARQQYETRPTA